MRLRLLGNTKLKQDATCPYCKEVGKKTGSVVEIIQDMNTNTQYATFTCDNCKERVMIN